MSIVEIVLMTLFCLVIVVSVLYYHVTSLFIRDAILALVADGEYLKEELAGKLLESDDPFIKENFNQSFYRKLLQIFSRVYRVKNEDFALALINDLCRSHYLVERKVTVTARDLLKFKPRYERLSLELKERFLSFLACMHELDKLKELMIHYNRGIDEVLLEHEEVPKNLREDIKRYAKNTPTIEMVFVSVK